MAPDFIRIYSVAYTFKEQISTSGDFYIKPLIPLISNNITFYVLALNLNQVRLFRGDRFEWQEVKLKNFPTSLSEALKYDDPERQIQFHTGTPSKTGERAAIFHGHGTGIDDKKKNISRFFHQIDKKLNQNLAGESIPMILAGVEYMHGLYHESNNYPNLIKIGLHKDPEGLSQEELHKQTWSRFEKLFRQDLEELRGDLENKLGTGLASNVVEEIVPASFQGRIDTLFLDSESKILGRYNNDEQRLHISKSQRPNDVDLIDMTARYTMLNDGSIYHMQRNRIADETAMAALFRY
jgi:hypothetical protein